ncbi:2-polyprenyl-3-methyl-5-hydroxy-6-metoxy-1,4-benzoquinol methylase [Frateuria terrea]|uniref:2-polyprenyl-3-methyl-5-hydroxy-6-metoxy-1,4-benzoquinol methylase n=2 Tax=Frateuria terrea TaxID=529704 RepID=A0A1H6YB94_9GAMM|nr:2-polyprenyl-3-methyl-5-hydroxy-6-metoxy-1,4-benzoquinol methylase [Frateuria terrea]SFP50218.1 2-polyprenyl-3-methyl-5-hydroxy-6-metoxy-1,4-benzoquinol methylase [Frateuria terrea]
MTVRPRYRLDRSMRATLSARFSGFNQRQYVRGKLAGDPVYGGVARLLQESPPFPLLDVGCGIGLLGHYLHGCGVLRGYVGIDHDERKIATGRAAAAAIGDALDLRCADVADLPDFRGHVCLLDVLHYLSAARQSPLLEQLAGHVAPGAQLMIRNVLRARHWRFHATVLEEHVLHATGWMRVGADHYPTAQEVTAPLERAGLTTTLTPLWGRTPFNSYLVVARRPA